MTNNMGKLLTEVRVELGEQKEEQRHMLDDIASKVFDVYRIVLGDDFTTQGVIHASIHSHDIRNWGSISTEMQDALWALCARYPESVGKEVPCALSDGIIEYLKEEGVNISEHQIQLFPYLIRSIIKTLEQAGAKLSNDVKQACTLGLKPLVDYRNWLISGGQRFMDFGQYDLELRLTDNAIKANQNALAIALVAAEDVKVDYGLKQEKIEGIVKADIKQDRWDQGSPFVVTYETKNGKKGEIDVLKTYVTSLTEKEHETRIYDLLYDKKINAEHGIENLGYNNSIEALVGLPKNITEELRANVWRKHLRRFGVDLSQNAEVILVDPIEREKVTFFYGTKNYKGNDNKTMVAFTFDERYGNRCVHIYTKDRMQKDISRAEEVRNRFDTDYKPFLEPMAVRAYAENKQRLTQHKS